MSIYVSQRTITLYISNILISNSNILFLLFLLLFFFQVSQTKFGPKDLNNQTFFGKKSCYVRWKRLYGQYPNIPAPTFIIIVPLYISKPWAQLLKSVPPFITYSTNKKKSSTGKYKVQFQNQVYFQDYNYKN